MEHHHGKLSWIGMAGLIAGLTVAALLMRTFLAPDLILQDSGNRQVMGTIAHIIAAAPDKQTGTQAVSAAWDALVCVDELMSGYKPDSDISRINRDAATQSVKVDGSVIDVLLESVEYSRLSGGAFDITVGPELELWRLAARRGTPPTDDELAKVRQKVGYDKLIIDQQGGTVRFAVEGMKIDVGGIAKGYGIDAAITGMEKAGALGGMVDVGGDIRVFGSFDKKDAPGIWKVGLQDPTLQQDMLLVLELQNKAVATSGDYRRFVMVGQQKHSHIVEPAKGRSASELTSVSVIAPTATQTDALATAVSVMGRTKGMQLIESLDGVEAMIIPADDTRHIEYTSGGKAYVSE